MAEPYSLFGRPLKPVNTQGSLNGNDADFDCMPMNMDALDPTGASNELQGACCTLEDAQ